MITTMKRTYTLAAVLLSAGLALPGCGDQIMDLSPLNEISEIDVWRDPALAESFLLDIYRGIGHGYGGTTLWVLTDDGHNIRGGAQTQHNQSNISAGSLGPMGGERFEHYRWGDLYRRIRQANIFLSEIGGTQFADDVKRTMQGEAHFLRAYFYHNLLKVYGGVPLITQVYGLNEDYTVARASFEETVDFIVAEAEAAAALLPAAHPARNAGRVTRGAALALKARVLLFAASDLYHVNPSGMPETGYATARDRRAHWRAAKDAARDVMDLGTYALFRAEPAPGQSPADNYADIWLTKVNEEHIFVRYFIKTRNDIPNFGRYVGPNGYRNWGSNTPTHNVVDAYRMADGSRFDWNNPEHASAPYSNRDPRFYASIQFDGARWVPRPNDVVHLDPVGIIQTFAQLTLPDGRTVPGIDTRSGPIEDWNGTYSGYYLRKFVDPSINHQFEMQEVPWVFMRYAEILLNFAEASIELGEEDDARWALNQIRRRAGMPEVTAAVSGQSLRDEYRNERRVEMAFEEQRFFDVRRWMIAPQVLDENGKGIRILVRGTDPTDRSTYYDYQYSIIDVEQRRWDDKMYFLPIHRDEINRNYKLTQNPGY
jgi:starch-binding outer membrane protein, SusD/RagB family